MAKFDPDLPLRLKELQSWFGSVIASPLNPENRLLPQSKGRDFRQEATCYILPRLKLESYERIGIYHQQYWWRLLSVLHENFPLLTRVLGYSTFNQKMAIPFLLDHPPKDFALCRLGEKLPAWIREKFPLEKGWKYFAQIDWAANQSFWMGSFLQLELPLEGTLALQPHAHLFSFPGDLFSFRETLLKEGVEYWQIHALPAVTPKRSFFLLYRSLENNLSWSKLSLNEYRMLRWIQKKVPLENICQQMEQKGDTQMPLWLFHWAQRGIFFDSAKAAQLDS